MEFPRLTPHASHPAPALDIEAVALILATDALSFRYTVRGDLRGLSIPKPGPKARADGLWRHTCFEAFVRPKGGERYVELNFSPSGAWGAYSFDSYRLGMQPLNMMKPPVIRCQSSDEILTLDATVTMKSLRFDSAIGLTSVIEDAQGAISYWALSHPQPKPDFHDADGWTEGFRRLIAQPQP